VFNRSTYHMPNGYFNKVLGIDIGCCSLRGVNRLLSTPYVGVNIEKLQYSHTVSLTHNLSQLRSFWLLAAMVNSDKSYSTTTTPVIM
jgi:hypothetical protein